LANAKSSSINSVSGKPGKSPSMFPRDVSSISSNSGRIEVEERSSFFRKLSNNFEDSREELGVKVFDWSAVEDED
jgi:hypothetical protein